MDLQFYCPRWGSETIPWDPFLQKVADAGYDGIEYGIGYGVSEKELDEVWSLAAKRKVRLIAQCYDTGQADHSIHVDGYCAWLARMKPYRCEKIDSQTGRDIFSFEQNKVLIDEAARFTRDTGVPIVHETHRNKALFAAHVSREILSKMPDMVITFDVSHWVNVAESYLEDQPQALQLAIERAEHIHARVGYPEGPQVPDPRIPGWQEALTRHIDWWDRIARRKRKEDAVLTITPEFGPYPYMVPVPATGKPISDQWEVNVFMMDLLKNRYGR